MFQLYFFALQILKNIYIYFKINMTAATISVLEQAITWQPFVLGITTASATAYYLNNFVVSDLTSAGDWSGNSGNAINGLSAATIAVQCVAILEWTKFLLKRKTGSLKIDSSTSNNANYGKVMFFFWWLILCWYVICIIMCSLNIDAVNHFGKLQITNGPVLTGTYANAMSGMCYSTLAVGGIALGLFLYGEFGTRNYKDPKPMVTEIH